MKRFVEAAFRRRRFCLSYAEVAVIAAVGMLIGALMK
jgi:hypothetical protein